jgi:hypothetical protein
MKMKFLIIVLFSIVTLNLKAQEEIFEKIDNKTWFENVGFAGTSIVFYKTTDGLFKAIRQINGSGVPVIGSEIYDVAIRKDTIYLLNGLNLKTAEKIGNYYYNFDSKTGFIFKNEIQLKILSGVPILFTWTEKRKDVKTQIDVESLMKISINENEIYKESDLVLIQKDK